MTRFVKSWLGAGGCDRQPGVRRRAGIRPGQGTGVRLAVRPHRADGDGRHGAVPRLSRLYRPGEQQGRRRGLQDQGHRGRQRVQGAAGDRGARALQEGRRGPRGPVRHAADRGAEQEARGGQDPRHLAGLRHGGGGRRQALPLHLPDRGQLLVAGRRGGRSSSRRSWAEPQGQEDRLSCSTTIRPARSRCRSSRISPRPRASSCAPSRCRRRASRWARRSLDIVQRFKPDFVITHLFGRAPSVSIKELKGKGYPAQQGGRLRVGQRRGRHHRRGRHGRWPRATTPSSSPASARTSRC